MTVSENIGHTLGLLSAVFVALVFPEQSPQIMLVLGSVSATLAVVFMSLIIRKENYYENIRSKG